jgi:hypothetical protein
MVLLYWPYWKYQTSLKNLPRVTLFAVSSMALIKIDIDITDLYIGLGLTLDQLFMPL